MGKNSFFWQELKTWYTVYSTERRGNARAAFCRVQMEGAMIHQFKIILEIIYDPGLQMLDLRQKNPCSLLLGNFFFPQKWAELLTQRNFLVALNHYQMTPTERELSYKTQN